MDLAQISPEYWDHGKKPVICKSNIITIITCMTSNLAMAVLPGLLKDMAPNITVFTFWQQEELCFWTRFSCSKVCMILSHKSNRMLRIQHHLNVWDSLWHLRKELDSKQHPVSMVTCSSVFSQRTYLHLFTLAKISWIIMSILNLNLALNYVLNYFSVILHYPGNSFPQ